MKYMKILRNSFLAVGFSLFLVSCGGGGTTGRETARPTRLDGDTFNFIVANDLGRNGYYDQKPIAEQMGRLAEEIDIEFVAAAGDIHHFEGVASVEDPLWMTDYELVYSHPELMLDWYPILGNHEYRGNTQAVLDYGGVSRRWVMPGRYYTKAFEVDDDTSLRVVWVDTTPLIDKYHEEAEESYRDIAAQDMEAQLRWIDSTDGLGRNLENSHRTSSHLCRHRQGRGGTSGFAGATRHNPPQARRGYVHLRPYP